MKIKTPNHAADDPLNRSRKSGGLKPLTGEDFHGTLAAIANTPAPATQPTAQAAPVADLAAPQSILRPFDTDAAIPGFKGQPKALEPLAAPTPPLIPMAEDDTEFAQGLPRHQQQKTEHDKVVETARKLVAQTFYGTMLKQMRNSPFKSEMFEGGRGGQAFAPMLDQKLAEHMARSADSHLVNAIARKLEGRAAYQQQVSAAKSAVKATQNVRTNVAPSLRA